MKKPKARLVNGKWFCKCEVDNFVGIGDTLANAFDDLCFWKKNDLCPISNIELSPWGWEDGWE